MQFLPATFAQYDEPVPPGGASPPSPCDPTDAVYAAARLLCANGTAHDDYKDAIFAYNHSDAYVAEVWWIAASYGMATGSPAGSSASSLPEALPSGPPGSPAREPPGGPEAALPPGQSGRRLNQPGSRPARRPG